MLTEDFDTIQRIKDASGVTSDYYGKQYISVCRTIRRAAQAGNIDISSAVTPHSSDCGNNVHLVKLIESCGVSVFDFIRGYLYNIHPYFLEPFQSTENKSRGDIWSCDIGYYMKLVIKLSKSNNGTMLVVSFHESARVVDGVLKQSADSETFFDKECAVIIDSEMGATERNGIEEHVVEFGVQRGFIVRNFTVFTKYLNDDVALVDYKTISSGFQSAVNGVIDLLREEYFVGDRDVLDVSIDLNTLSFLSMGYSWVNSLSLLLDAFEMFTGSTQRLALVEAAGGVLREIPLTRLDEIKAGLRFKYRDIVNYDNVLLDMILGVGGDVIDA